MPKGTTQVKVSNNADPGSDNPDSNDNRAKNDLNSAELSAEDIEFPFANELDDYVSYNYVFTFSCLTKNECAAPDDTYRKTDPKIVILRSGGGVDGVDTEPEQSLGSVEYFIDNVEVQSLITPNKKTKQTNATSITFDIIEPYSMGIFLQELKVAALTAGYTNYIESPFLLTVEFKGWDDDGNYLEKKHLRRMWPMKLISVNFAVNEGGSTYNVEAIPWGEQATLDQVQSLKTDIKVVGSTVKELLQTGLYSLSTILNSREQEKRRTKQVKTPDEYVILFPKNPKDKIFTKNDLSNNSGTDRALSLRSDLAVTKLDLYKQSISSSNNKPAWYDAELDDIEKTVLGVMVRRSYLGEIARNFSDNKGNNNVIGRSKLVDNLLDGTKKPFGRPRLIELDDKDGIFERGQLQISDNLTTLTFKAGTTIQDVIEEIILLSEYGTRIGSSTPDANGMIPWFRIDTEVYDLDDPEVETQTGRPPRIYVFRVVPFSTHLSRYASVTQTSATNALRKQCVKEYNYIYTGKNDAIIDFDITYNRAFHQASTPFGGSNKGTVIDANASRRAGSENIPKALPSAGEKTNSKSGYTSNEESFKPGTGSEGGGQYDKIANVVARDFNDAILNSTTDLINTSLVIWGDPYYIIDSGFGNYFAIPHKKYINLNKDGTMNYQDSEVHVIINFRTPFDHPYTKNGDSWDTEGFMDFYADGSYSPSAFSGIYQVTAVTNSFSEGKFTQKLDMIRIRNQEGTDTNNKADLTKGVARTVISNEDLNRAAGNAGGGV